MVRAVLGTALGLLFASGVAVSAIDPPRRQEEGRLVPRSTFGQDLFQVYCSTCHGGDGKGRLARTVTRIPPPDLTTLSLHNGGTFPRERVTTTITNGGGAAHQWSDMPDWGVIFRGLDSSDAGEILVAYLVEYIESLQEIQVPGPRCMP